MRIPSSLGGAFLLVLSCVNADLPCPGFNISTMVLPRRQPYSFSWQPPYAIGRVAHLSGWVSTRSGGVPPRGVPVVFTEASTASLIDRLSNAHVVTTTGLPAVAFTDARGYVSVDVTVASLAPPTTGSPSLRVSARLAADSSSEATVYVRSSETTAITVVAPPAVVYVVGVGVATELPRLPRVLPQLLSLSTAPAPNVTVCTTPALAGRSVVASLLPYDESTNMGDPSGSTGPGAVDSDVGPTATTGEDGCAVFPHLSVTDGASACVISRRLDVSGAIGWWQSSL